MGIFNYTAVRADGQRFKGSIEATALDEAKRLLREQQLIIIGLEAAAPTRRKALKMTFEQRVIFTSQLAQLLEANVPLYESLEALEEQAQGESYQPVISAIREQIRKGVSFSAALGGYPDAFSAFFRAIVVAGESVGRLDTALMRLNQLLTADRQSRQRLISALLYPSILAILLIAAMCILIFFVIPSIEGLFEGRELPAFTSMVISIAHFVHRNTILLGFLGSLGIVGVVYHLSKAAARERLIAKMLRWPIIGPYLMKSCLARFAKTLSNLLAGGTPLSSALVFAKEAIGNPVLELEMERASKEIIEGQTFSSSLRRSSIIPPLFARMVSIGEETGRLAPILANVANLYEEDSDRLLERAVSLLQPLLLVTMGLVIGATLLAILLPLADFGAMLKM
jgi:general secretion pathway protein F/type IV pilus assembly protein PilC